MKCKICGVDNELNDLNECLDCFKKNMTEKDKREIEAMDKSGL